MALLARILLILLPFEGFILASSSEAAEVSSDEYALMALYTYNFAKFTEWPPDSFAGDADELNLCIIGDNPFGVALARVEGKPVKNRVLKVKHYPRVGVVSGCHIVFISRSEHWRLQAVLRDLASLPALTVSDIPKFSQSGGMITLSVVDQRLRFAVNVQAAAQAGLRLSSKLLELAQIVTAD